LNNLPTGASPLQLHVVGATAPADDTGNRPSSPAAPRRPFNGAAPIWYRTQPTKPWPPA